MALVLPTRVRVRAMTPDDVPTVIHIERASFPTSWRPEAFHRELANATACYVVAHAPAAEVIGFGGMWLVTDEGHITTLAVHPDWRRQGVGRQLLAALLLEAVRRGARRMTLEVRAGNEAARALYEQFGFRAVAVLARYYRDTAEDALVMVLRGVDRLEVQQRIVRVASASAD